MADKISLATLALAKAYTDESIEGAGAIKGKNCQIQSITNIEGGHRVTFAWYNESEVLLTDTLDVMDGENGAKGDTGNGIVKIEKTATSGLTDTYTITFTDGETFDYDVVNGADGAVLSVNGKTGNVTLTTSDLVNDSGFIQNTVNNLVNYYLKSQIYTKTEVEDIVSAISTLSLNPVEQLPTTDISTTTIYLIPSSTQGVMDQYINLDGTTTGWVKIGDTSIDLTNYVTTSDLTLALADYVTEAELSTYVVDANYVHTDNNYTDTDKAIVDGVTSALALKADKSEIPENTSDLTNDSGFISNTVNNLANYYLKTQTYTQSEVDALIAAVKNGRFISVATLPTTDIDTKAIYLVPSADPQTTNIKDEYINIDGTSAGWELIGSTAIDLSGYVTDADLTTALADYTTTANLTTLLAAKQDTISDLATIRSGASAGASAYQKPATGIPKTDLASAVQTSLEKADSAVQDVSGKADKVLNATNGNFAGLGANGNLTDSGSKASDFATPSYVDTKIKGAVIYGGAVTFANLPAPSASTVGKFYLVTDAFTTTNDFVVGAGKAMPVDSHIAVINIGTDANPNYKYDDFGGFVDISGKADTSTAYLTSDTAETDVADDDYFPFYDTSASGKRKTLWSTIKWKIYEYITSHFRSGLINDNGYISTETSNFSVEDSGTASSNSVREQVINYTTNSVGGSTISMVTIDGTKYMEQTINAQANTDTTFTFSSSELTYASVLDIFAGCKTADYDIPTLKSKTLSVSGSTGTLTLVYNVPTAYALTVRVYIRG